MRGHLLKMGLLELRDGGDGSLLLHPRPPQAALRRDGGDGSLLPHLRPSQALRRREVIHFQSGNFAFSSLLGFY